MKMISQNDYYDAALAAMTSVPIDTKLALKLLRKAHRANDGRATYALATWYLFGYGELKKNLSKAIQLLNISAERGVPDALFDLAVCYEQGEGVVQDSRKAACLYLEAAIRGDTRSHFEIGRCYFYGIGFEQDEQIAEIWFRRAEELGVYEPEDYAED